jgi:uncharacterized phage-associated protein
MARNSDSPLPNLDKIGQLIIYLVDKIEEKYRQKVYLTKLLKLFYIIDETAIKETGAPVTGLDYRVWKMGPVAFEVYKDLMHDHSEKLSFFAEAKKEGQDESALIQSVNQFDDSEFSDYEMDLFDRTIESYGHYQGNDLIELLHEEGSLWKKVVDERGLAKKFEHQNTSNHKIDFSQLVAHDPRKLQILKNAQESLNL